jgi:hypothetical protein
MLYDVREGMLTIEGDDGQRIGIRTDGPSMRAYIGEGVASISDDTVGIGICSQNCRLEVRSDRKVGMGRQAK